MHPLVRPRPRTGNHVTGSRTSAHHNSGGHEAAGSSSSRTYLQLCRYLAQRLRSQGIDFDAIWLRTTELVLKSLLAVQES